MPTLWQPSSVPGFLGAQILGLIVGVAGVLLLFPNASRAAADVLVPHADRPP